MSERAEEADCHEEREEEQSNLRGTGGDGDLVAPARWLYPVSLFSERFLVNPSIFT